MDNINKVVWFVEDSDEDGKLYPQLLNADGVILVRWTPPPTNISDLAGLVADPTTGAIVLDERLGTYSGVPYTGLEAASFLRPLRPALPIYILTNYENEIPSSEGESVEFIIDKASLRKAPSVWVARILRAMQQYESALSQQQHRLKELIDRKLTDRLTEDEEAELTNLRAAIERPFALAKIEQQSQWEEHLQRQEEQLDRLERLTGRLKFNPASRKE